MRHVYFNFAFILWGVGVEVAGFLNGDFWNGGVVGVMEDLLGGLTGTGPGV